MSLIIGLDIGGTNTKIIGFKGDEAIGFVRVKASDPLTSAFGGVGKFLDETGNALHDVSGIYATGVGSAHLRDKMFGVPTQLVPEFDCVGLGGLFLSGLEAAIVVSMGTGTSIVAARKDSVEHIIGSGVGGGTLTGLSEKMLNIEDFETIDQLASKGNLERIDLNIGDITMAEIPGLSADTTASNFGKLDELAEREDFAAGIVNLVFQSVGTASILAARIHGMSDIIITGNLSRMTLGKEVLNRFTQLYGVNFFIPENSEFATAIGAGIFGVENR
ncbi:MAG: pantothenate kinase [Chloroflexi bacterium]|nr:pantothenate kinase [Chloroflexota bacterium]